MVQRSRRPLVALVTATLLALAGLTTAPAVQAATAPAGPSANAFIAPTTAGFGSTQTYTLTVHGSSGNGNAVSRVEIDVPVGFTPFNVVSGSWVTPNPSKWETGLTGRTLAFKAKNGSEDLGLNDTLSVRVTATANAAGAQEWTTRAFKGTTGSSELLTVGSQPVVTVSGGSQTITFNPLPNRTYAPNDSFTASASSTGGSGQPVTFGAAGNCTSTGTNGSTIGITGAGSCTVTASQAGGNGYSAATPVPRTFSILKASQSLTFKAVPTQTYDPNGGSVSLHATSTSGLPVTFTAAAGTAGCSVGGDLLGFTAAGTCDVTATQPGNANYESASSVTNTAQVSKAAAVLTISGGSRTYDGSAQAATVTTDPAGLTGVTTRYSQDGSPVPAPTNVGSFDVTATLDNPNYAAETARGSLVISPRNVSGTFTVSDKEYDGNAAATVTGRHLVNAVAGDDVHLAGGTATFDSKDAGDRAATLGGATLSGGAAANYTLTGVATANGTITPKSVTASLSVSDKTYDGNDNAPEGSASLSGVLGADEVGVEITGGPSFADRHAGAGKTVTATVALTGDDAGNYQLGSTSVAAQATIFGKELTGGFSADDKAYDGGTAATVASRSLPGVVGSDDVTLLVTGAQFADANVGDGKAVTATLALAGGDKADYTLFALSAATTADITPRSVTAGFTADDKTYDGGTAATGSATLAGVLDQDVDAVGVHVDGATFASKDAGTWPVTAAMSLTGTGAGNYALTDSHPTDDAAITAKSLTGSFTAADKVYDGDTHADVTGRNLTGGIIGSEDVTLAVTGAHFGTPNVGTGKTVTGNLALSGDDQANYALADDTATTTADITAKELTGSITAADKVYDGDTHADVTGRNLTGGIIGSEDVTLAVTGAHFDGPNVGTGKTVTGNLALSGDDQANYALADDTATTTADITPLGVTASFTAADKAYDGSTAGTGSATLAGVLSGDAGTVGVHVDGATFGGEDVGTWPVTADLSLSGDGAGNYALTDRHPTDDAAITAKSLTGSFTATDKVYDGDTHADVAGTSLGGVVGSESVTLAVTNAHFGSKDVGTGKTVTGDLALAGADRGNYSLSNPTATTSASITAKDLFGSFTAADKVWDGTVSATITGRSLTGKVAGDVVGITGGTATFGTADVGGPKTVTGTGFNLTGTDAGNYHLAPAQPWTTQASITSKFALTGFYQPVDMNKALNTIKAGQAVPLKFEVFGTDTARTKVTDVTALGSAPLLVKQTSCLTGATVVDAIEVTNTGATSLRYDTTGGQFIQNWKTPGTVNTCYEVSVKTPDGTTIGPAYFKTTK